MDSEAPNKLKMFFFPYILGGHLIPMIDLARVFASHGVKATIVTTPHNALLFRKPIHGDQQLGRDIAFQTIGFRPKSSDCPTVAKTNSTPLDIFAKLFTAAMNLQQPLENLLRKIQPDCLVSDRLYPWTAAISNGLGIPRIVFDGTDCFSHCVEESIRRYAPHEKVVSDAETFVLPGLPDRIELKRSMMPDYTKKAENVLALFLKEALEGELKSFGVVVNSFYELEKNYADFFNREMGRKTWHVGLVSLCNRNSIDKLERGIRTSIDEPTCLNWLGCKEPGSVIYISFRSKPRMTPSQLLEIAHGLEASEHPFIWVIGRILRSAEKKQGEIIVTKN